MDLYDYYYTMKKTTGLTMSEFAAQLKCTRAHVQGLIDGSRHPSFNMAQKIEEVTRGQVKKREAIKWACDCYDRKNNINQ